MGVFSLVTPNTQFCIIKVYLWIILDLELMKGNEEGKEIERNEGNRCTVLCTIEFGFLLFYKDSNNHAKLVLGARIGVHFLAPGLDLDGFPRIVIR